MPCRDGIPVTIITGHLGAGKTTLLNRLLEANRRRAVPCRLVVIENEFAMEFGVEEQLLLSHCEPSNAEHVFEVFEFGTGCLCCSSFKQFVATLMTVAASAAEVDHVLVETTGLAGGGPDGSGWAPVFQEPTLAEHFRLQGVVTVVDAANFLHTVWDVDRPAGARNEAAEQVAVASVVVLNKLDLVGHDPYAVTAVEKELRALNPTLRHILRSVQAEVDVDALLGSTGPLVPTPEPSPSSQHDASVTAHCLVRDASLGKPGVPTPVPRPLVPSFPRFPRPLLHAVPTGNHFGSVLRSNAGPLDDEAATAAWVTGLVAGNGNVL
eukprot:EG_transcript_19363